jgi:predicted CXXCH cytochrome family protein
VGQAQTNASSQKFFGSFFQQRTAALLPVVSRFLPAEYRARVVAALCVMVAILVVGWLSFSRGQAALAPGGVGALTASATPGYAGSAACAICHGPETKAWLASHHAHAMAEATKATVSGDFSGTRITFNGSSARFFRDGGRFLVETEGRDGKPAIFQVSHTFGVAPLQQYLVTFPDGRLQALPWAWDMRPKSGGGQRWFHLYQYRPIPAADPLHWTRPMQNWNYMCAECHSTDVHKNYDAASDRFKTSFSEISVGCETCHGPAAGHVAWANGGRNPAQASRGFEFAMARRPPANWATDPKTGSPAHGVARPAGDEVETCAICHSRRGELAENWRPGQSLLDTHLPPMLDAGLFEDDGQMKDEVFNDHAFKQSLMYARGVVCTDCHDPHTAKLKFSGAAVCAQCHMPSHFDTVAHTGHAKGAGAPDCISCHMPARTYMVVDRRHDHSFRIPRPDISAKIGTPNACNDCHTDKSFAWAADAVTRWHGAERHGHQTYAEAFHAARAGDPAAREALLALAADSAVPGIARATALTELQRFASGKTDTATAAALADADPMVRIAALRGLAAEPAELRWQHANALLTDTVPAVRMEAAVLLADLSEATIPPADLAKFEAASGEYEAAQRLIADRPEGRANLGNFMLRRGNTGEAEEEFKAGLKLAPDAAPLYANLADLYRGEGRESDAEATLRAGIASAPQAAALHYALGLSFIRQKNYVSVGDEFARAVALAPDEARYAYVYAVAQQSAGNADEAGKIVQAGLAHNPTDPQLLALALNDALKRGDVARAAPLARLLSSMTPDDEEVAQLAARLNAK